MEAISPRLAACTNGVSPDPSPFEIFVRATDLEIRRWCTRQTGRYCFHPRTVQLGADPNAPDMSGRTLLAWSSFGGGLEVVRAMIEAGADVNMKARIRDVCREIDI